MRLLQVQVAPLIFVLSFCFCDPTAAQDSSAAAHDTSAAIYVLKENIAANKKTPDKPYEFDSSRCDVRLVGKIGRDTAKKFQALHQNSENELNTNHTILLCLDSTGGEVAEALALARFIRAQERPAAIVTVVQNGAVCYSACALVFMAGNAPTRLGPAPLRMLEPNGRLMFHSTFVPDLSKENLAEILKSADLQEVFRQFYAAGLRDVQQIVSTFSYSTYTADFAGRPFVAPSLFLEAFSQGPDEWVCIDNVDKVGRWNIQLSNFDLSRIPSKRQYYNVCRNAYIWSRDENAAESGYAEAADDVKMTTPPANRTIGGRNKEKSDFYDERVVVDVDFAMKASRCVVEVTYAYRKKPLIDGMKVYFIYHSGELASGVYEADSAALFAPDTPIADLAKKDRATKPAVRRPMSTAPAFSMFDKRQMAGCELRRIKNVELAECENSCEGDRECFAFSYNKSVRACSIKHKLTALRLDPLWQTGIRPGSTKPKESIRAEAMVVQDDSYALKGKLLDTTVAPFDTCLEKCKSAEKCVGVTFTGSANRCQQFESIDSMDRSQGTEQLQTAIKRQE